MKHCGWTPPFSAVEPFKLIYYSRLAFSQHTVNISFLPIKDPSRSHPNFACILNNPNRLPYERSLLNLPVSATCPRETLEAAWLGQMGYTHKRQLPKWTNETTDVPIGSQGRTDRQDRLNDGRITSQFHFNF